VTENPTRLTTFGGRCTYPAYSPDGKQLAFVPWKPEGKAEVVVAAADGKNPTTILMDRTVVEGGRPAWRPK